jgi:ribosomal protein S18 acetylase RimI-like enzyme
MNDFEIRRARSDDAEPIADVHLDSRREAMLWLPVLHSREETVTFFTDVLLREDVLVAEADRIVVGFIALLCDHIDHLYIAPAYQHRRIGDELLAIAKKLHPDGLTLWTFQRNARARRFYETRGFVASEFTDGLRNEEGQPDVLYTWRPCASSISLSPLETEDGTLVSSAIRDITQRKVTAARVACPRGHRRGTS